MTAPAGIARSIGGSWPTPRQELLLRACLLRDRPALEAWAAWRRQADLDALDRESFRLVPLLHENLARHQIRDEWLPRLKGIRRQAWVRNQMLFAAAGAVLADLRQAGIEALLLKGAALVARHYRDSSLRPMNDFDFLVPEERAAEALDRLCAAGWRLHEHQAVERTIRCMHATILTNAPGLQLDLHWHSLREGRQAGADDAFRAGAVDAEAGGVPVRCLNPTDLLLQVCAHGAVHEEPPPIRWIADAWIILETSRGNLDWDRLVAHAQTRWVTLCVGTALDFLRERFAAPVPDSVLQALRAADHPWLERLEYGLKSRPRGLAGALPEHGLNYLRTMKDAGWWAKLRGFPAYLQTIWGLPAVRDVPRYMARRALRRLNRRRRE